MANEVDGVARGLEREIGEFIVDMGEVDGAVNGVLAYLNQHHEEYNETVDEFLESLISLGHSAREGMEGFSEMDASLKAMGDVSKLLRPPARRLSTAFKLMIEKTRLVDEWEAAAIRLRSKVAPLKSEEAPGPPVVSSDGG